MASEPVKRDKFTLTYGLWAGALLLLYASGHQLDLFFNLYVLLVPLLLVPTIVVAVALFASLIWNGVKLRWRRCVSVVVGPMVAAAIFWFAGYMGITPDRIRFEITKSYYTKQIAQMPRERGAPLFAKFDWGNTGGAGAANIFRTLVFDESDQLLVPDQKRSDQWKHRAGSEVYSISYPDQGYSIEVKKMGGHFYLVTEIYQ
jgi:hypothetical protein